MWQLLHVGTWVRTRLAEGSSCPAAGAAAAAEGLAFVTAGGVVEAPAFLPKKDAMSRCFIAGQAVAWMIWLAGSLSSVQALLTVPRALIMQSSRFSW